MTCTRSGAQALEFKKCIMLLQRLALPMSAASKWANELNYVAVSCSQMFRTVQAILSLLIPLAPGQNMKKEVLKISMWIRVMLHMPKSS